MVWIHSNDKYFNYYLSMIPTKFKNRIVYRGEVDDLTKELENKDLFFKFKRRFISLSMLRSS